MQLNFDNTTIHYSTSGKGKAVVLLHGFLESKQIWRDFIPVFSEYGQIITIDLPGHGRSGCLGPVHSMESMAEVVFAVLSELNIDKADIIGHSMGGYVALAFLEAHSEMVRSIMLLNSTPAADTEERKEIRDRSIELVRKNKKGYIKMAISNLLTSEAANKHKSELQELREEAMKFPTKGITANLEGMKIRTNRTEVLRNFSGAKIIIAGKDDPIVIINEVKALAQHSRSTLISFPGGHLGYLENKKRFTNLCISSNI